MKTIKEEDERSNGSDTAYFSPDKDGGDLFNDRDDNYDSDEEYEKRVALLRAGFDQDYDEDNQPYDFEEQQRREREEFGEEEDEDYADEVDDKGADEIAKMSMTM